MIGVINRKNEVRWHGFSSEGGQSIRKVNTFGSLFFSSSSFRVQERRRVQQPCVGDDGQRGHKGKILPSLNKAYDNSKPISYRQQEEVLCE